MWTRLEQVDLSDVDHLCMPSTELLKYIKAAKDKCETEVPYVDLSSMCTPEWSK